MIALVFGVAYILVVGSIFNVMGVFADSLDRVRDRDIIEKGIFMYVFNDKTQLWDRAREETLKNATCEKLHTYVIGGK